MPKFAPLGKVTPDTWVEIGNTLRHEGHYNCTIMNKGRLCGRQHEVGHHAIVGGDYSKGKKKKKLVDVRINYQPSCFTCNHKRIADTKHNFRWNIKRQRLAGNSKDVWDFWNSLSEKYIQTHVEEELIIREVL